MRKYMWKKGISMTLAAVMLAGTITVPTVYREGGAAVVQAAENEMQANPTVVDGMVYATVDMEYADFYYGELNDVKALDADAEVDLSVDKVTEAGYRDAGMYDAVTSATTTKSIKFGASFYTENVVNDETDGEAVGVNINGVKAVKIAIPKTLYDKYLAVTDEKAKSHKVFSYLSNLTISDVAFDEYKVLNADGTFSKMQTNSETLTEASVSFATSCAWGNYQLSVAGLPEGAVTTDNMMGVVIETSDGAKYGMLHEDNLWIKPQEIAFVAEDVFEEPHGNHVPGARFKDIQGKTITKLTYLVKDGTDLVIDTNIYCKKLVGDSVTASTKGAVYSENGSKVAFLLENLPADDYQLSVVKKGSGRGSTTIPEDQYTYDAANRILTLSKDWTVGDDYYAIFSSETYSDFEVGFSIKETKDEQTITTEKDSYTVTYGKTPFNLNAAASTTLTYTSSNTKVAAVDKNGKVTIKGAGTAVITLKAAEDDYYKEASKTIKITVNKKAATISGVSNSYTKAYGNKAFKLAVKTNAPKITYKSSSSKIASVSSKGYVTIKGTGIATITITASGSNYKTAVKKVTVKVAPKKQTVTVKSAKKKQLTVQVKKDSKATGYQIKVSTSSKFTNKTTKTYTIKSYKTYKKVISSLKSGKKYYVKARSYKTSGKTTLYGAYSNYKSIKVK